MKNIKFSKPNISLMDIKLISKILKGGWLTHGKYTSLFEMKLKNLQNLSMLFPYQVVLQAFICLV